MHTCLEKWKFPFLTPGNRRVRKERRRPKKELRRSERLLAQVPRSLGVNSASRRSGRKGTLHYSAHHARVLEHRQSLLERGDLLLTTLLALLEGYSDVVAGRAEIRNVLHDLGELLPIGGKLDACVAEALVLLALLGLLGLLRLRGVLAELLVLREQVLVRLLRGLLTLHELRAGLRVAVQQVLEHLHRRSASPTAAGVLRERRLLAVRSRAE